MTQFETEFSVECETEDSNIFVEPKTIKIDGFKGK